VLDGSATLAAAVSVKSVTGPAVSSSAPPAGWACEEAGKERVELCDSILRDVNDNLLVIRCGGV
jgi:hypothetical protein